MNICDVYAVKNDRPTNKPTIIILLKCTFIRGRTGKVITKITVDCNIHPCYITVLTVIAVII